MTRIVAAVLLCAAAACSSSKGESTRVEPEAAKQLLINRNWLDRMPEGERDKLHVYRFVPSMGGGVYQDRTLFKGTFELFSFEATGDAIRFVLHETHDTVTAPYSIEKVDGPAPFDLMLTIDGDPRGPTRYFGIRAETGADLATLDAQLKSHAK